jgi:hypothetical protein
MTVTYPGGTVLNAILLSHEEHEIRAISAGCDDVLAFTRRDGAWHSEENEPVTIEFEWQRRGALPSCSEDDYVCPKELASRLISKLLGGGEPDETAAHTLYFFSAEGALVTIRRTELERL